MGTANSRAMAFNSNLNPFAGIKKEVANFGGNWGDWAESRMEGPLRVENKKTGQWDQVSKLEWKDLLAGVIYLNETKPQLPPDSRQVEAQLWQEATTVRERVWQIAVQTGKGLVLSVTVAMSVWSCFNLPGLSAGGQPNPDNPDGNSPENGNDGGEQDLCLPGMGAQIDGASAKFTGVKSAFSVPESTLNNLNPIGEPPVNNYLACAVNVEGKDYDYQSGGPILESANGDKVMAVVRPLPERIGSFLAVFPNETGMAVEHGGEVFRAAVMADFSRAQIENGAGGLVMVLPEVIIDGDTGNAVDTGGGVILSVGADGSISLSIGGIRTTVIDSDDAGKILSLQQAVGKLQQVEAELAVSTHEGQNMANMRTTAGEPMNGNANKIGLSEQAVKVFNDHNYIVVSVDGGADNPNIVSWCEAGQCLVSPTPELFIPGGVLDAAAGVDNDGMVTFRMDDGSVQKGLVRLPQVEGASWVWVVEQVDGETPGKAWVALVKDSGGKSGQTPEILGKFQAIFADGVNVQINETENGFTLVITGADGSMIEEQAVDFPITYTLEDLEKMPSDERLAAAPEMDGLIKYQLPNRPDSVLYRSADGGDPVQGFDLKTGEMFEVMGVSFDPDNPTDLTQADFDSGKWLDSERLMCDRLPDTAQVPEWKMSTYPGYGTDVFLNGNPLYVANPDTSPQKICSFAQMELDFGDGPEQFVLIGVVTKSADGSQRILHLLREEKPFKQNTNFLLKNRGYGFLTNLVDESTDVQKNTGFSAFRDVIGKDPIMLELGRQLAETGIITEEMEQKLFVLESRPLGIEDRDPSEWPPAESSSN